MIILRCFIRRFLDRHFTYYHILWINYNWSYRSHHRSSSNTSHFYSFRWVILYYPSHNDSIWYLDSHYSILTSDNSDPSFAINYTSYFYLMITISGHNVFQGTITIHPSIHNSSWYNDPTWWVIITIILNRIVIYSFSSKYMVTISFQRSILQYYISLIVVIHPGKIIIRSIRHDQLYARFYVSYLVMFDTMWRCYHSCVILVWFTTIPR